MPGPHLEKAANGFYYVHWTAGRRSCRESARTKELAAATLFLKQWIDIRQGAAVDNGPRGFTAADLFTAYRAGHVIPNNGSTRNADNSWRNLGPFFGRMRPAEIDHATVERYAAARTAAGRKSGTVRREIVTLTAMLNWAADPRRKLIAKADVHAFTLPAQGAPRDRWLTTAEISKLLDTARQRREQHLVGTNAEPERLSNVERFLWIGLQTGAREQAIIDLTWDRVDFETGMIDFNQPGRRLTKKRRVAVPMSTALRSVLTEAFEQRRGPFVLDSRASLSKGVRAVAAAAGIAGVGPHVLRHTAATHMARRGVPLFHIAGVLGNTVGMVERVYAKHCPAALAEAVEKIGAPAPNVARIAQLARKDGLFVSTDMTD